MKILIVDDSAAIRLKLKNFVKDLGHTVVGEAENGLDAIDGFQKLKPDLVTMDLVMPQLGGLESTQRILQIDPKACVVVVTSAGTAQAMRAAKESGAYFFLTKPFTKDTVNGMLAEVEKRLDKTRAA